MIELKQTRKQNFDLLRIISMVLVTTLHYLSHSGYLQETFNISYCFGWLFETYSLVATDVFIIISSHFLCEKEFRLDRAIRIYVRIWLISILGLAFSFFIGNEPLKLTNLFYFAPVITREWGFVNNYLLYIFLFPIIKRYCDGLTRESHKKAIIIGTIIFVIGPVASSFLGVDYIWLHHGDNVLWFLYIYFVVCYLNKYRISISMKKALGLWSIPPMLQWISRLCIAYITESKLGEIKYAGILYNGDCNPFTFLSALGLFFVFDNIKIDYRSDRRQLVIATLGSATFAVYLIQEHPLLREWFWKSILMFCNTIPMGPILAWLAAVTILYLLAVILDKFTGVILQIALKRR